MQPSSIKKPWWKTRRGGCAIVLAWIVIVSIINGVTHASHTQPSEQATTTSVTQQASTPTAITHAAKGNTPTAATVAAIKPTHGTPRLGSLISDFYGKYGKPNNQGIGNSETWLVGSDQSIILNAGPDSKGRVTQVGITGPDTWNRLKTENYCDSFLPPDATSFNRVDIYVDYHSSLGEIVFQYVPDGGCTLTIAQN